MNIFNLKLKDYIKVIFICLGIIGLLSLIFFLIHGSFIDGLILTFIGIAYTYLLLTLFVLSVKFIIEAFSKEKYQLLPTAITVILLLIVSVWLFRIGFNFIVSI